MISALTRELRRVDEDRVHLKVGAMLFELLVPAVDVTELQASLGEELTFHPRRGALLRPRIDGNVGAATCHLTFKQKGTVMRIRMPLCVAIASIRSSQVVIARSSGVGGVSDGASGRDSSLRGAMAPANCIERT